MAATPATVVSQDEWCHSTGDMTAVHDASDLHIQTLCSLWAGMGHIYKVHVPCTSGKLQSGTAKSKSSSNKNNSNKNNQSMLSLIVKHIVLPTNTSNQSLSNQRKTDSYFVEANFYEKLAPILISQYKISVPTPYLIQRPGSEALISKKAPHKNDIVIAMSYVENDRSQRHSRRQQRDAVLTWLAQFHAVFWGSQNADAAVSTYGLQPEGSYWYLNTRPDEHDAMPSTGWIGRLKTAARAIADYLQYRDIYQCIIHGDAKEANILYASENSTRNKEACCQATFCDYQYCGKGSLTKDLVYYLMRFDDKDDDNMDEAIEFYLLQLKDRLPPDVSSPTLQDLQISLSLAYCDLYRFMIGWGNWGSNNRPNRRVTNLLNQLDNGIQLHSEEAYDAALRRQFG